MGRDASPNGGVMVNCLPSPEGGLWGHAVVFASWSIQLLIIAITRCTGILFLSFQSEFEGTTAETGAISSIMSATSYFGCTIGGALGNRLGCRFTAIVGGVLYTVGMVGGSLSTDIYQMYILGTIAGSGTGIAATAGVVAVAQYFTKDYTMATGLMYSGLGVGMLVLAPFMQLLLDRYGWRGTMLITGAVVANVCAAGAVFRPVPSNRKISDHQENLEIESDPCGEYNVIISEEPNGSEERGGKSETSVKENSLSPAHFLGGIAKVFRLNLLKKSYRLCAFCFAQSTYVMSYICFVVYLIPCATKSGVPDQKASFLISIIGILSLAGYLLCGFFNKKVSSLFIYAASMFVCGCAILVSLLGSHLGSYEFFAVSTAVLGFAIGFQHTIQAVLLREYVGVDNLGSAVGIYSAVGGVANLAGPIVAGAIYDATGSYDILFCLFAGLFFLGFLAILLTPLLRKIEPGVYEPVEKEHV